MRLTQFLAAHAARTPDRVALVCGGRRLTLRELHEQAEAVAGGLSALGVTPGDRVLMYLPNGVEFVILLLAGFTLGAIVVPVNTRLTARELAYLIEDSEPAVIAVAAGQAGALPANAAGLARAKLVVCGDGDAGSGMRFDALMRLDKRPLPELALAIEDCMILYTSGTTGKPKGALITHANVVIQNGYQNVLDWGIARGDCFLVTTPLAHRTGMGRMINAIFLGATLVLMERFDAKTAIDLIERESVTVAGMVPTVARMLLPALEAEAHRCGSLRHLVVTGEAFPVEVKRRLVELLPDVRLHSYFAMTEAGAVTGLGHEEQFIHPASVGRVTPGIEVKMVDAQNHPVAAGEVGELLVRAGPPGRFTMMRGYYNRPDDTAAAMIDGWLHTGDMARFDAEGYLYIVDRKKDMVLSGGFNIYTKEVEQALLEHPAIADCAVVGIPDETYGEAVVVYVELKPGERLSADEVIEHAKARIASYKKPRQVHFVAALPRNALGKVLKAELRRRS